MPQNIQTIGVAGAGVMGQGIAALAAQHGRTVVLYDPVESALEGAAERVSTLVLRAAEKDPTLVAADILARIRTTDHLTELRCDLVIEAAPERLAVKHELFHQLEAIVSPSAILATNTSTIPVTRIAGVLRRPERCVGLHFFNPVAAMRLVELIAGRRTDLALIDQLEALMQSWGKTPIRVADSPGFVVNRVARPYYLEALRIAEEGLADYTTIDALLEAHGFRMGPFKLMDLIGIDTNHSVSQSLYDATFQEPRFRPSRLQQQLVDARLWGRKVGRGFYRYDDKAAQPGA